MSLVIFRFTCETCGQTFEAPHGAFDYGEFCMRGERDDTPALLLAIEDPVYKETSRILREMGGYAGMDDIAASDVLQRVFGAACDLAPDGTRLALGRFPHCPRCGSRKMASWDIADPPRAYDGPTLSVTHREWSGLTAAQQKERLRRALATPRAP